MALPPSLGIIQVYQGDPLNIIITVTGVDLTNRTFTSQIRTTTGATSVAQTFAISTALVSGDTVITMSLTGDSSIGVPDGQTRNLPGACVFDVEQALTSTGRLEKTLCTGTLTVTGDVTR